MTEDDAKTKTCWRSIGVAPVYAPDGSGLRDGGPWPCIGSECMAWRTYPQSARVFKLKPDGSDAYSFPAADTGAFEAKPNEFRVQPAMEGGFCGLAGAPQ